MTRGSTRGLCTSIVVAVLHTSAAQAGDGVVALQTADPSCPDDSGNIYVDCGNGTVTDNRTGLVWLKNASCLTSGGEDGRVDWHAAMEFVAGLSDKPATSLAAADDCGLSDGSSPGEWRLPSRAEWETMIGDALGEGEDPDCTLAPPTITSDSGLGCWVNGLGSFTSVKSYFYWTPHTQISSPTSSIAVSLESGEFFSSDKLFLIFVWPVRGGQ